MAAKWLLVNAQLSGLQPEINSAWGNARFTGLQSEIDQVIYSAIDNIYLRTEGIYYLWLSLQSEMELKPGSHFRKGFSDSSVQKAEEAQGLLSSSTLFPILLTSIIACMLIPLHVNFATNSATFDFLFRPVIRHYYVDLQTNLFPSSCSCWSHPLRVRTSWGQVRGCAHQKETWPELKPRKLEVMHVARDSSGIHCYFVFAVLPVQTHLWDICLFWRSTEKQSVEVQELLASWPKDLVSEQAY